MSQKRNEPPPEDEGSFRFRVFSDPAELDLVANQDVVHQEADPAEGHDGDGEENLEDGLQFVVFEDVEHAPDCGDDAGDVNDSCDHILIN